VVTDQPDAVGGDHELFGVHPAGDDDRGVGGGLVDGVLDRFAGVDDDPPGSGIDRRGGERQRAEAEHGRDGDPAGVTMVTVGEVHLVPPG
jgi:hypothetical protein